MAGSVVPARRTTIPGSDPKYDVPHREGIVEVYDWNGRYLGCLGVERWRELLARADA